MKKRMLEIMARKAEIAKQLEGIQDRAAEIENIRALNTELTQLNEEYELLEARQKAVVSAVPGDAISKPGDADQEYRKSFMNFVLNGTPIQQRTDATAKTTDITAVIPTSIVNKIVDQMKNYGDIFARVTRSNIPGGVQYPVSSLKPTATWTSEGSVADKQKMTVTAKVAFSYYKLQCRVAVTIEADVTSLSAFEDLVSDNVAEAMYIALEKGIISGSGDGQPKGITLETVPAGRSASVTSANISKYTTWAGIVAKVPKKYRKGSVIVMSQMDWDTNIVGMTDATGQPVARTTIGLDGMPQEKLLGFEVIPVEEYLDSFEDADNNDVIGFIFNLKNYVLNSNMKMTMKRYFDEDTDEWITKATVIADGKCIDVNGLVLIKASK